MSLQKLQRKRTRLLLAKSKQQLNYSSVMVVNKSSLFDMLLGRLHFLSFLIRIIIFTVLFVEREIGFHDIRNLQIVRATLTAGTTTGAE